MIPEALGTLLVGGGLLQLGLVTAANLRRLRGQHRQSALSLQLLETELQMMRDLRQRKAESGAPWNGWRKFLVAKKVMECDGDQAHSTSRRRRATRPCLHLFPPAGA